MSQEQNSTPGTSGTSPDEAGDDLLPGQDPRGERPIEVKRTPRLRSGKQEDTESSE